MSGSTDYEVLGSERLFEGKVIALRRDTVRMSDGVVAEREIVEHIGAVGVVAIDEHDRILMVNQYRHAVGRRLDELPAGLLDMAGEPALAAAKRELAEEAGMTAREWHVLVDLYSSPGFSDEAIRIFLARDLAEIPAEQRAELEHEELTMTVHRVPLDEAAHLVTAGRITNSAAVAGILAAAFEAARNWHGLRPADAPWPARPEH